MGFKGKLMSEVGQALGRKIFGETIPETVQPMFKEGVGGISRVDADTFSKAIDFDPEVREPLDALFRKASEGDDDAYIFLEAAAKDFATEDQALRVKSKAEQNFARQQRKALNIQSQMIDDAANPAVTGSKGRKAKEFVATADKDSVVSHHQKAMTYQPDSGKETDRFITEGHHVNILDEYNKIPTQHSSYAGVTPESPSPIVQVLERIWGTKAGNAEENVADVLATMTKPSRMARVAAITEQTKGVLHQSTLDDLLGKSKYKPREFTSEQLVGLNQFKKNNPGASTEDFISRWTQETGEKIPEGSFPNIRVYAPDAVSGGKKKVAPLEIIEVKDQATHSKRVELTFDALERHGVPGVEEARKAWSLKDAKIDSKLDIYGSDHEVTHEILRELKQIEGTAQFEIEQLGPDGIFNLPFEDAVKLQIRNVQEMETVLANVLQYRYKQVKKLFNKFNKGKSFEKLSAGEKQAFFKANVNQLAVMGNLEKAVTIDNALNPIKGWNNHISDVFGWKPQSLWMSIEQMEEIIKEVGEKVPATQPIPGFE